METELRVTSPTMKGEGVLAVQQRLEALGYAPGELDADYGPATAGAVRSFQRDHDLAIDGIVGPATRAALDAATPDQTRQVPSEKGLLALAESTRHIGTQESPAGSNRQKFGVWFGVDGVAWCNIFVSYCFSVGAGYTLAAGYAGKADGVYPKGCAYVPTTEAWLRASGMWLGRATPLPGDLAIYNWNGGDPDHIGIVERYLGDGTFQAIEGNTSARDNSNGGEVQRTIRRLTQVDGFGRIA
jgi:hypothetical protein